MSHSSVLSFGERSLTPDILKGVRVLEVGAYDINGSLRPYVEPLCKEYIGVDLELGPKVDKVVRGEDIVHEFGKTSFDLVISSEMMEHAEDWRTCINQIKDVSKRYILVTTRSEGFPYHGFPADYWRYSLEDMRAIFDDCDIISLENDDEYPGVMMLCRKTDRERTDLRNIELTPAPLKPHWH